MDKIQCPLDEAAEIYREQPALICSDRVISYQEYRNLVSTTAQKLKELGVEEGERVAILLPNDWRYVIIMMALLRIRAIACPLNNRAPPQGLRTLLDKIACQKLITSSRQTAREIFGDGKVFEPQELVKSEDARQNSPAQIEVDLEQPATIVFTSGSLGVPKAVLHSYGNHYYNANGSNQNIPLQPGDRWLLALPLFHVGGLSILFRCLLSGAAVVIPEKDEGLEGSLIRYNVTHLSLVPTQLYRLLREESASKIRSKLRAILLGGAAVPMNLLEEGFAYGLPLYTSYGLTEIASQVIKGETLFKGYIEREGSELPVDSNGWFATGDLGQLDPDGYLTVTGRKDNMFISGGENIQPEEIERTLCEHTAVTQAVVVPVPDEEFDSRPVAFVQTRDGKFNPQEMAKFLEQRLARYKIPVAFYDWPESAGTEGMKFNREIFRRLAGQTSTRANPK